MKKLLFASMLALSAAAWAVDPLAVWDGADSNYDFSSATRGIFTITATNGNTIASDGITISDSGTGGVVFEGDGTTLSVSTFIIRGSGLNLESSSNQYLLSLFPTNATVSPIDTNYCNFIGASISNTTKCAGIWQNNCWFGSNTSGTMLTSGSNLVINVRKTVGVYTYEILTDADGNEYVTNRFTSTGLKSSSGGNLYGFTLGNTNGISSATLAPAAGWKIEKIAYFGTTLTTDQMLEYRFPSEISELVVTNGMAVSEINAATSKDTITLIATNDVELTYDAAFNADYVTFSITNAVNVTLKAASGVDASADDLDFDMSADVTLTIDTTDNTSFALGGITATGSGTLTLDQGGSTIGEVVMSGVTLSATALKVKTTLTAALVTPTDGSLTITVPDGCSATQSGVISGTGALIKDGAGTLAVASSNTFTGGLIVSNGTMKAASSGGYSAFGYYSTSASLSKITVESGATLDVAYTHGYCYDVTLNGGTMINDRDNTMGTNQRQVTDLTLTADSTVGGSYTFGLLGNGHAATSLSLAGHTLTKTNSNDFMLYNTTVTGDSGTIQIDEGTVTLYSTCTFSGTTVSLGTEGTLVYGSASVSGLSVAGSGTVNLGTYRPSNTITFAEENSLTLNITLSSTEAGETSTISIPYTGTVPTIAVYESDAETAVPSTAYTVDTTTTEGKITLTITYTPSLTYTNPVTETEQTFTYAFTNLVSSDWASTDNWYQVTNNRYVPYTANTTSPYVNGNRNWAVFDDKQSVTSSTSFDIYNMRVGLFNGSTVTIPAKKFQQAGSVLSSFWVDATSKLTINDGSESGSTFGNTSGNHSLYVAAADGIEFTFDLPTSYSPSNTYYLAGAGSVKFNGSVNGVHTINTVVLDAYTTTQDTLTFGLVRKHPLVTFGTSSSPTIITSGATVKFDNSYSSGTTGTASEAALTWSDVTTDNAGKYYIYSDDTGIYIDYIGYASDAEARPGIRVYIR